MDSRYRAGRPSLRRNLSWLTAPAAAFLPAVLVAVLVTVTAGAKPFYWDSGAYWMLADAFVKDGSFAFTNFDDATRGYLLPLAFHLLREAGALVAAPDHVLAHLWNAALFGLITTVLGPVVAKLIWPRLEFVYLRRLLVAAVFLVFWHGYLSFPLSDLPALALALAAIAAVGRWQSPLGSAAAGAAAGAAVMVRPAYLLIVPAVVLLTVWRWRGDGRSRAHRAAGLAAVVIAAAIVALPQALIAHQHFGSWTPIPGGEAELSQFQLTVGLERQRYETYVGTEYPSPQLNYYDRATEDIRNDLPDGQVSGYPQYVQLIAEHPITMAGVFARRIVNGLDQRFPTPYVEDLDTSRLFRGLNFTVLFLALVRLAWPAARRRLGGTRFPYLLALLVTCATTLPSAMETRFLLPVYLLAYLLALGGAWPRLLTAGPAGAVRRLAAPAAIGAGYVVFMAAMWLVVRETTSQLPPP